jgi:hypothetical protein
MPKLSYDNWEHSYFPYLIEMYRIVYGNDFDVDTMNDFFQFIYSKSSGKISIFLDEMDEETQKLYNDFQIKRNTSFIK